MIKELPYILASIVVVLLTIVANTAYPTHEKRKAYYVCLQVVEKIAEQQKQDNNGGIRIVSLPICTI